MDIEDIVECDGVNLMREYVEPIGKSTPKHSLEKMEKMNEFGNFKKDKKLKVFVKTWGCSHNISDGEYMSGIVEDAKERFELVSTEEEADVWILNGCTAKTPSEDKFKDWVRNGKYLGKKIVAAGCIGQVSYKDSFLDDIPVIGVNQIDQVKEAIEQTKKKEKIIFKKLNRKNAPDLKLPKKRKNKLVEILAINSGCLNTCSYCKTKMARGNLKSYSIDQIKDQMICAFDDGVKEVWLTSEDSGAYGQDLGVTIIDLLNELVKEIPDGCRMRIGMTNPPYVMNHMKEMCRILKNEKVYSFIHIPVQSGSNDVLGHMRREYSVENFKELVNYLKKNVPRINIATDFICGYPTETEEDFQQSLQLIDEFKFTSVFINQFYPRSGTIAATLPQLTTKEKRRRTALMTEKFKSYEPYDNRIGKKYEVLIVEENQKSFIAHNKEYEQIVLDKNEQNKDLMGRMMKVEITDFTKFCMKGLVISDHQFYERNRFRFIILLLSFLLLIISYLLRRINFI
ncbi:hypothetical protein SNEBB_002181 [Seison nebaliae]|nr:hypothetical protein SNEBB_002181 [Seison nebaliae]